MEFFLVGFLFATLIVGTLAYKCFESRGLMAKRFSSRNIKLEKELADLKHSTGYEIEALRSDINKLKSKGRELKIKIESLEEEKASLMDELEELKED